MRARRLTLAMAALAVLAVAALLVSAGHARNVRSYAMGVPDEQVVATLDPGKTACEGPIVPPVASDRVAVWLSAPGPATNGVVTVRSRAGGRRLATAPVTSVAGSGQFEPVVRLDHVLAAGQAVTVCVTAAGAPLRVWGSFGTQATVTATGVSPGMQFSMLLYASAHRSLLSWLPLAFDRASLWKTSWVGSWTFWLLAAGLLACFGIAIVAVTAAVRADAATAGRGRLSEPLETGEDRPQPVGQQD